MEKTRLNVNPLPVKTWHWLRMNDSELDIRLSDQSPEITFQGERGGLKRDAGRTGWKKIETGMGHEFAALMDDRPGFFLNISDGYRSVGSSVLRVDAPAGGAAGQILIHAGKDSESAVVIAIKDQEEDASSDQGGVSVREEETTAIQLKFYADEGAKLALYVAQTLKEGVKSCVNIGGVCGKNAVVSLTEVSLGSSASYAGIAVALKGDKSVFHADLGCRVKSSHRLDLNYVARHTGKETESRMNGWGVLEDGSFKLFRGTIDFAEGCSGSTGSEKEDVLLLGEQQVNQTIPLILCHEEDVEGNHGATIGRLDDSVMFYLGSRGIDAHTAEEIIARARLDALIERFPDEEVRSELLQR